MGKEHGTTSAMTDKPIPTHLVNELFHATGALLTAMKEPEDLAPYIEGVEDALASIERHTGWNAEVEAELDRQLAPLPPA